MDTSGEAVQEEIGDDANHRMDVDQRLVESSKEKCRHVLELISNEGTEQMGLLVNQAVTEQLRNWGIDIETPGGRGRTKIRKSNSNKAGRSDVGANRLVPADLRRFNVTVMVPVLIKETCDFLREHIQTEGIFRKSGSSSRVQALMQRFFNLETQEKFIFTAYDSVFDVATVLKQYLREMESPLVPYDIHNVLRKCMEVSSESSREEAVMLTTCLLPVHNLSVLTYLIEFLVEVVENSEKNRMTYENLAIVVGPNIIPVESKKSEKAKELEQERKHIEAHTKIMETLLRNSEKLGCPPLEMCKKIESNFSLRGSEDELENDGVGRRKKRRSGSLTRVLGFLKKVASTKSGETSVPQTPGEFSDFTHTPVIKSSKRRCLDENIFSLQRKKTILDGIRKNGLIVKDDDKRFAHITSTPNSVTGFITCPSPVCLNPSPMKMDWKQTPNGARLKNLVTPSLLRRKEKNTELNRNAPFSAPAKPVKAKLGIGKKSSKKHAPVPLLADKLERAPVGRDVRRVSSIMSIHKLPNSPRKVARASSTRIPRPDKVIPVRKSNSSCRFPVQSPKTVRIDATLPEQSSVNTSGEYVTLSPSAHIRDEKNEAFIASKISCLEDTVDEHNESQTRSQSHKEMAASLRLTPLIQEINTLTLTARQELTLSGLRRSGRSVSKMTNESDDNHSASKPPPIPCKRRSSGASNKPRFDSPPINKSESRLPKSDKGVKRQVSRSNSIRLVEDKFKRAIKETKIMRIQSENNAMKAQSRSVNIHRRFSVQDKGFSPSHRRIMSVARRRSHELNRGGVTVPLTDDQFGKYDGFKPTDSISRSPNRCTLKRGRPNTLRSGLARPSPASARNTSATNNKLNDSSKENPLGSDQYAPTPLRRMSSVQELVKLMEKGKKEQPAVAVDNTLKPINRSESKRTLSRRTSSSSLFTKPAPVRILPKTNQKLITESTPKTNKESDKNKRNCRTSDGTNSDWVAASDFNFESHRKRLLMNQNEDRDSIQALKALNAGKVSENVRLFDGMCRTRKSPGKSLIPRYVALHRQ
ncbi:unnamed protein product [Orchesella dallaii]|uniref:Rho-GAP domain-containing protein n=1 Tax=Orchesella dallaii TaxID=48710 RepID=A0ABP1QSI4_9HEXA